MAKYRESTDMIDEEIRFMKKNKAPKKMLRHEQAERQAMAREGYAGGGVVRGSGAATRGKRFSRAG